jgi:hypothetical protein
VNQDYDLHLYRWPLSGSILYPVASSTNSQNGGAGQTPEEFVFSIATGGNCYLFVIERVSSTRNVCLSFSAPQMGYLDEGKDGRSLTFPADSPDAITVGAVDVSSYNLEGYSSRGPTFGSGGSCSGGSTKPDIAAYANVSTVSYGGSVFNGTSAATPHVAGAAALVKDFYPGYTVSQLQSFLENEAIDLGAAGKDNRYGSGRLYMPYNSRPAIPGLPDQTLAANTSLDNAIDLWDYASDAESPDSALTFSIDNTPNAGAGVSIDSNRYVDINPTLGWTGQTDVVIRVTDPGGLSDTDTFRVTVVESVPDPAVSTITPNSGNNNEVVHITNLAGGNFQTTGTTTVTLLYAGETISATNVTVVTASQITCDFDLRGASPGQWTVRVTNPNTQYAKLDDSFAVKGLFYLPIVLRMLGALWICGWDMTIAVGPRSPAARSNSTYPVSP